MNIDAFVRFKEKIVKNCGRIIVGKDEVIEQLAVCLVASGHVLLEDVPGTGKTMLLRLFILNSREKTRFSVMTSTSA